MSKGLNRGSVLPDFTLPDENGDMHRLSELQGDDARQRRMVQAAGQVLQAQGDDGPGLDSVRHDHADAALGDVTDTGQIDPSLPWHRQVSRREPLPRPSVCGGFAW